MSPEGARELMDLMHEWHRSRDNEADWAQQHETLAAEAQAERVYMEARIAELLTP